MSPQTHTDTAPLGQPLELLFERRGGSRCALPAQLSAHYGGELYLPDRCLFANFVASLDGVVALPGDIESGQVISGRNPADRFVMGLLRSCADTVLVGAGTFRRSASHLWRAETIYPAAAALFGEARRALGLPPEPTLVLVSASGKLDLRAPAARDAWIVTTRAGELSLRAQSAPAPRLSVLDGDRLRMADVVALLHAQGARRVLTEGGPSLFAELALGNLIDELFLTSSPTLFGRYAGDQRKSLADGLDLAGAPFELSSARRHDSHLFLRYKRTSAR